MGPGNLSSFGLTLLSGEHGRRRQGGLDWIAPHASMGREGRILSCHADWFARPCVLAFFGLTLFVLAA